MAQDDRNTLTRMLDMAWNVTRDSAIFLVVLGVCVIFSGEGLWPLVFVWGFLVSMAWVFMAVEDRWPCGDKVRFGNFGQVPKNLPIIFCAWIPAYLFIIVLICKILGVSGF